MAGWTYDQMLEMYKKGSESMGGDPEDASCFIEAIKKVYSAGRDMSGKMEWSRLHALHTGDSVRTQNIFRFFLISFLFFRIQYKRRAMIKMLIYISFQVNFIFPE